MTRNGKWYNNNSMIVGDDNRANLFLYIIRYASIHKPRFLLLENVKGLTRVKNNDGSLYINTILSNLYEIGYKVVVKVLNSADYGLPQQRKRTFFCCFREISDFLEFNWPEVKDRTVSIANILENNVNEKYWLINRWKGRKNQKSNGTRLSLLIKDFNKRNKDIIIKKGEINMIAAIYGDTPSGAPRQQDKLYSKYGISPTIATFELSIPNIDTNPWRVLTPRECARLQGFPESLQLPEKDTQAYKQCGNAISVPVAQYILESFRSLNG